MKDILANFGVVPSSGCQCEDRVLQMDSWGIGGCKEHREEIVGWLRAEWEKLGWLDRIAMAARAVTRGFVHPVDPVGALIDEAIRRAEQCCGQSA